MFFLLAGTFVVFALFFLLLRLWRHKPRDVAAADAPGARVPPRGLTAVVLVLSVAVLLLGAPFFYLLYGVPAFSALSVGETPDVAALESYARQNPDDAARAFAGIAAAHNAAGRYAQAIEYYEKARAVAGDTPELLAAQLDVVLASGAPAQPLLTQALAVAAQEPLIFWLAGYEAHSRGDLRAARGYWQQAHNALPPGSEERAMIADALDSLVVAGDDFVVGGDAAAAAGVLARVRLADAFLNESDSGDALFVYALNASGERVPLAAGRWTVGDLPLVIRLDDAMAMLPNRKMSDYTAYLIIARVSKSGEVTPQSGDLFGDAAARPGDEVDVLIDRKVP